MVNDGSFFVVVGIAAFLFGLRASVRLTRRYMHVSELLLPRERLILGAFVVVAWVITVGAGVVDFLTARRLLGYDSLDWAPVVVLVTASVILFIPVGLDLVVSRVARVPVK